MNFRLGVLPIAVLLLVFGVLIAACSSDSDDSGNNGDGADATEPAGGGGETTAPTDDSDDDGDGSSGSGSTTLTIGGETWSFDDVICGFSPEDAGNDFNSFSLSASGETAEGVEVLLQATILDKGNVATYSVSVVDAESFDDPALGWSSLLDPDESEPPIQVDGKNVTADTTFDDQLTDDVIEEVPGTLVGVCP